MKEIVEMMRHRKISKIKQVLLTSRKVILWKRCVGIFLQATIHEGTTIQECMKNTNDNNSNRKKE